MSKAREKADSKSSNHRTPASAPFRAGASLLSNRLTGRDGRLLRSMSLRLTTGVPVPGGNDRTNLFPGGGSFTASGTSDAGTTLTVQLFLPDGSVLSQTALVQNDGTWSVSFPSVTSFTANTPIRMLVSGTNAAGVQIAQGIAFFQNPEPAPAAPSLSSLNVVPAGNHNLTVTGKVESGISTPVANSNFTVVVDGAPVTPSLDSSGNFTFDTPSAPGADHQDVTIRATNDAGATSEFPITFDLDITPPTVSNVTSDHTMPTNANFTLTGTASDPAGPGSGVQNVSATVNRPDGSSLPQPALSFTDPTFTLLVNISDLQEGLNTIRFVATDLSGNNSTPVDFSATLDTKPPVISNLTPDVPSPTKVNFNISGTINDPSPSSGVQSVTVVITRSNGVNFTSDVPNHTNTDLTFPVNLTQHPGVGGDDTYVATFTATDAAGNDSAGVSYSFQVDTTPPTINVSTAPLTDPINHDFTITGTATDAGGGVQRIKVTLITGGTSTSQPDANFSGNPTFTFLVPVISGSLANGQYTVQFEAIDLAGNVSTAALFAFTVDTTRPTPTLLPAPDRVPTTDFLLLDYGKVMNAEAFNPANYGLSGITGVTILSVTSLDDRIAEIVLSAVLSNGQTGTLTISSPPIADRANNQVADASKSIPFTGEVH